MIITANFYEVCIISTVHHSQNNIIIKNESSSIDTQKLHSENNRIHVCVYSLAKKFEEI